MKTINFKNKVIIIADDNPENIHLLLNTLGQYGLRIIIAKNGKEVLERLKNITPDLILLDVSMPEMDGFEVCKILKEDDKTKDIPVIFMTASFEASHKAKGFNLGAVDYIPKPFHNEEVLSRIKVHLTIRELQTELLLTNKRLEQKVKTRTKEIEEKNKILNKEIEVKKKLLNKLSQSEERFRQTLEFLPIGYYEMDKNFNLIYINKAGLKITGYDDKLDKIDFDSMIVESKKAMKNFKGLLNNKKNSVNEYNDYTFIKKNMEKINVRFYSKPINKDNKVIGIKGVFIDITEQKKMENEKRKQEQILMQSEKMISLGELSAGIAHEINQPLSVISIGLSNMLNLLNHDDDNTDKISKKINKLEENVTRIQKIIENIRIFSREQKNEIKDKFNYHLSIDSALSLITVQYKNHNIEIEKLYNCNDPVIIGNKYQFEQVILNLLSNSKYSIEKKEKLINDKTFHKKITIKTYNDSDKKIIEIIDNGLGISEKIIKKIFDPFFTSKSPNEGTGLGLSISYGIIKEMNGIIQVISEEKKFAVFRIIF